MKKWLAIILLVLSPDAYSQDLRLYQKKEYQYDTGKILPYRILYPEQYDKGRKYPLVVFLHGSGERGNDNEKQLIHGSKLFLADSNRRNFPAIVVFPQCPVNISWHSFQNRSAQPGTRFNYPGNTISWPLDAVRQLVQQLLKEEAIDKKRCYISGLSMGGHGTFEMAYRFPKLFAAALPICGGGDSVHYDKRVRRISFWIFHGDNDKSVDVEESRKMLVRLKALRADVTYTEYPGVGHNSWDNAFAEPTFLSWMFSKKRRK